MTELEEFTSKKIAGLEQKIDDMRFQSI